MSQIGVIAMSAGIFVFSFSFNTDTTVLYATVVLVTVYDNAVLDSMISMSVHTHTVERTYTYRKR